MRRHPVLCRPGGLCEGPKPDPIPNSAVKSLSAYGTKPQGLGESVAARPAKHRRSRPERIQPSAKRTVARRRPVTRGTLLIRC
jgi:hypothetical protein